MATRGRSAELATTKAHGLPKNRLETLVDGVFAIAMTILVLELRAPQTLGPGGLAQGLVDLGSRFATFLISFIVLGVYWFAHHQVFHFVLRVNRTLVWLNILFLMGIASSRSPPPSWAHIRATRLTSASTAGSRVSWRHSVT